MRAHVFVVALVAASAPPALAQSAKAGQSGTAPDMASLPDCAGLPAGAQSHDCACRGEASPGSVWGSGPYTGDSDVCAAARHAGAIGAGGGPVRLIRRPGADSYQGSQRNGVATRDWGSYDESFDVVSIATGGTVCVGLPGGVDRHVCSCEAGAPAGSVWGSGPYTADSDICTAARHDGALAPGAAGAVAVMRVGGLDGYRASTANGVTTMDWGSYGESFVFDRN